MDNPNMKFSIIKQHLPQFSDIPKKIEERLAIEGKYQKYISIQNKEIKSFLKDVEISIPEDIDFYSLKFLSNEARERLTRLRPPNIVLFT